MGRSRSNRKNAVVGLGLIALAAIFWLDLSALWPLFVLLPGLALLGAAVAGRPTTAPFAIPGAIVTGTAVLLFVQNVTNYWGSWAYAWTLYGVFFGAGFVLMGRLRDDDSIEAVGRSLMLGGLLAFAGFAFFFEVIIGLGGVFNSAWWTWLLVGAVILILLRSVIGHCGIPFLCADEKRKRKKNDDALFTGPVVVGSRVRTPRHRNDA